MTDIDFFYNSAYRAELYDLQWNSPEVPDMSMYWKGFADLLAIHQHKIPSDRPFTVLDVGTGTGCVLLGLLKKATAASLELSDTEFIGMDNAQHMLDLAKKNAVKEHYISPVTWVLGSAIALQNCLPSSKMGILSIS